MSQVQENLVSNEQIAEILYKDTSCKKCIYILFRIGVYLLVLIGIGDLLGSILVYTSTKTIDWYNGGFAFLGLAVTFLAAFSYMTRESVGGTFCYLLILFFCFLGQIGLSFGIIFYTDYQNLLGFENAQTVRYSMMATAGVIFFDLVIGIFYYCMISKEFKKRYNYYLLYGENPDDIEPIVGENLWRKYERTMVRWNRLFE